MKNVIFGLAIMATTLAACNNGNNKTTDAKNDTMLSTPLQDAKDTTALQLQPGFRPKRSLRAISG